MGRPTISETGPSSPKRWMGWVGVILTIWKIPGFRSPSQKMVTPWTFAGIDTDMEDIFEVSFTVVTVFQVVKLSVSKVEIVMRSFST